MGQATTWLYEHERQSVRERGNAARNGETAYALAAEKAAALTGATLSDDQQTRARRAIHWALGVAARARPRRHLVFGAVSEAVMQGLDRVA